MKDIFNTIENTLKNSRESLVKKGLNKLEVVSREEFDTQKKILQKTRLKLEELEAKIDKLLSEEK